MTFPEICSVTLETIPGPKILGKGTWADLSFPLMARVRDIPRWVSDDEGKGDAIRGPKFLDRLADHQIAGMG
ncbi:unnamed protein product [marine sediment metagenome]|uniref:Uncharacterized protein n=1 Tax=marine sediment metagenome TaxID=412755 RepID=X1HQB9_9ZZZZ